MCYNIYVLYRSRTAAAQRKKARYAKRTPHYVKDVFAMPPKARITKEMIVDAAFAVVRRYGVNEINVRKVANELKCSTQPVMYHFKTVEELKEEVYAISAAYFNKYVFGEDTDKDNSFAAAGRRCIEFARDESPMFRFIFQSGRFGSDYFETFFSGESKPRFIDSLTAKGLSESEAKLTASAFLSAVHGYSSLIANGNATYSEEVVNKIVGSFCKD